ncbi:MAG: O-antigen ligase family protein [Pyrinomonadaceae bacterium]
MKQGRDIVDYEPVTRSHPAWASDPLAEEWLPRSGWHETEELAGETSQTEIEDAPRVLKRAAESIARPETLSEKAKKTWASLKRGHMLAFLGLFLFTIAVYFRPYEFTPALAWTMNAPYWLALFTLGVFFPKQFMLEGNLTARPLEVNLILLLSVIALVAMPISVSFSNSFAYFKDIYIKIVLMFIVMVNVLRTERRLKAFLFLALLVAVLMSVNALNDYLTGNFTVEGYRVTTKIGVHGMFGNPDDMALHLVMMLPIAVALAFRTHNPVHKLMLAGCAVLMFSGILVSFSRGCFLGFVAMMAVLLFKLGRRQKPLVAVLFVLCIVAFIVLAPGGFGTRILSIYDHSLDPVGSATARSGLLMRSIVVSIRHPLLGVGIGNFPIVSIQDQVSHNAYTQVSAELGVTALLVYMLFMLTPLRRLSRIERETYADRSHSRFHYLAIGLQASLVAYIVASFFYSVAFNWNIYYLVGYAICVQRLYEGGRKETG